MIEISYSQISAFLGCPKRWWFSRQKDIHVARSAALIYGNIFDQALSAILEGKQTKAVEIFAAYLGNAANESGWNGQITYGKNDSPPSIMLDWLDEAAKMVADKVGKPHALQLKLSRDFDSFRLVGVTDCILRGRIIDFKLTTERFRPDPLQGCCYSLLNGGATRFEFWAVLKGKIPQVRVIDVPETRNAQYLAWIVDCVLTPTAKAMQSGACPANPSYQFCTKDYCSYWDICRRTGEIR